MIEATWIPSPFCWPGREGQRARYVIIHGTAGGSSAENIAAWFQNADAQACAHYVVGRDGAICQCVREADTAWANGIISGPAGQGGDGVHHDSWWDSGINPNLLTISIELVKPHDDNSDTITAPQQASCFALVRDICQRNAIPMRSADASGGITGHYSIDPVNRSRCPGLFAWDALWSYLEGDEAMAGVPTGWKDDTQNKVLTAPNGVQVRTGFRDYILAHDWDADNTPEQAEQGLASLEISNPGLGGGTWQPFKKSVLEWTAAAGVFPMYVGRELLVTRKTFYNVITQLNTTLAQVKALQAQLLAAQNSAPLVSTYQDKLTKIHTLSDVQEDFLK